MPGYKYSGKRTKRGLAKIVKVSKKGNKYKVQKGGILPVVFLAWGAKAIIHTAIVGVKATAVSAVTTDPIVAVVEKVIETMLKQSCLDPQKLINCGVNKELANRIRPLSGKKECDAKIEENMAYIDYGNTIRDAKGKIKEIVIGILGGKFEEESKLYENLENKVEELINSFLGSECKNMDHEKGYSVFYSV